MRDIIALVITAVWAVSLLASILIETWQPNPYLLATMLGLAAAVFGSGFWRAVR